MSRVPKAEILKDLSTYKKLEAVANSEGGTHIKALLLKDIATSVDSISIGYKTMSHTELIAQSARLSERLSLYRLLLNVKKNVDITQSALEEALKEDSD